MFLLDTCTLLWLAADQEKLSETAKKHIEESPGNLFISSISAFEIAVKHRRGALVLPLSPTEWVPRVLKHHGVNEIPVDVRIATRACDLPPLHNDPADRLIVATARVEDMVILTPDRLIHAYPQVRVSW